ncbi:MAG: methionine synthase, partial [Porphyrobacter sp.]|nr:methionine synthase [Porphyrobacter sp.]
MTEKRFLTTHVGSLPRPEALLDLVFAREDQIEQRFRARQAADMGGE